MGDRLGLNMTQHSLARDIIGLDNTTEQLRFREAFIAVVVEVLKPTLQHFVFLGAFFEEVFMVCVFFNG